MKMTTLLTAALSLIIGALSASAQSVQPAVQSADIPISSLPFNITSPGTYVVTGNLSFPSQENAAITIATNLRGPVILDLKGFTLTGGGGQSFGVSIGSLVLNTYPITIRDGTLQNFAYGVDAEQGGRAPTTEITVNNVNFSTVTTTVETAGVKFLHVSSSSVSNCTFDGCEYGIEEGSTGGGNRYTNDTFSSNVGYPLHIGNEGGTVPVVLEHCHFEAAAN